MKKSLTTAKLDRPRIIAILDADLTKMSKSEIYDMRETLIRAINWWNITPIHELRSLGIFSLYQKMFTRRDEMLKALKA